MTPRTEARWAGAAYLAYIASAMGAVLLAAKTTAGADTAHQLASVQSSLAAGGAVVLLHLLQIVCALVLAVTLYRLSRAVDATVALLALCFRVGEGLLGFLPLLDRIELMKLATDAASPCALGTASPAGAGCLAVASQVLQRPDEGLGEFCFVVGGFLFAWLFLRGRLIPRWLAWTGVVTIGLQLICVPLHLAYLLPGSVVNWLWFPILLYEVPLGVWLLVRGTAAMPPAAGSGLPSL